MLKTFHHTLSSRWRYWLFLVVTLVLNILFIIFFVPGPEIGENGENITVEEFCPRILVNGSINEDLPAKYIVSTFVLSSLYLLLAIWMVLEYYIVTWPHFVLPKILYTLSDKLGEYQLTAPIAR